MKRALVIIMAIVMVIIIIVSVVIFSKNKKESQLDAVSIRTLQIQLDEANSKNAELESKIASKEENVEITTVGKESTTVEEDSIEAEEFKTQDQDFINTIFWRDGKNYTDENTKFYTGCYCQQGEEITKKVEFISPCYHDYSLSNGITVYASLSTDGVVWSTQVPCLVTTSEHEE